MTKPLLKQYLHSLGKKRRCHCYGFRAMVAMFCCCLMLKPVWANTLSSLSPEEMLDLPLNELMTMEVTSVTRKVQKLSQTPAAVFVITNEDIRRSGVTHIADVLQMVPGLQVARIDANNWAISSRGSNGRYANKLLVQVDGRSVYTPTFSGVEWDTVDTLLDDIDRIEVIRGPGAALWGANAVNGIINIISKKAQDTTGTLLSLGAGNQEKGFLNVRHGQVFNEKLAARVFFKARDKDDFEDFIANDSNDAWRSLRGGFRVDGEFDQSQSWVLQGDVYHNSHNQNLFATGPNLMRPIITVADDFKSKGWNLLGRWNKTLAEEQQMSLQVYYDTIKRNELYLKQDRKTFDIDFQHQFRLNQNHQIVWGAGYRWTYEEYGKEQKINIVPTTLRSNLWSLFVQDEITLIDDKWSLTLGAKLEDHAMTGLEWQPSIRTSYFIDSQQTLWVGISRAVRTPSRYERDATSLVSFATLPPERSPLFFNLKGNPDFESEDLTAYELGYKNQISPYLSLDAVLFRHRFKNLLSLERLPTILIPEFHAANELSNTTYGLELAVDWHPKPWWRIQSSYTYTKSTTYRNGHKDSGVQAEAGSVPLHQLSLRSLMNLGDNWQLDFWAVYIDKLATASTQAKYSNFEVDAYTRLNLRLGYRINPSLEISVIGQNLLNKQQLEFTGEAFFQTAEVPRSVYAQVRWDMN